MSVACTSTPGVSMLTGVVCRSPMPGAEAPTSTMRSRKRAGSTLPSMTSVAEMYSKRPACGPA